MSKLFPHYKLFLAEMDVAYNQLKAEYGEEFDSKMAVMMVEITNLRYDCGKPGEMTPLEAAMLMMVPGADEDPADTAEMRKHLLAAVLWYQNEQDNIGKSVKP